jgi:hypothetical protein
MTVCMHFQTREPPTILQSHMRPMFDPLIEFHEQAKPFWFEVQVSPSAGMLLELGQTLDDDVHIHP